MAEFGLAGRVALVTGASRGLGRHFAGVLAKAGAAVALCARDLEARLAEAAREIAKRRAGDPAAASTSPTASVQGLRRGGRARARARSTSSSTMPGIAISKPLLEHDGERIGIACSTPISRARG